MSLRVFRDLGYRITFYCEGYTTRRACSIGWPGSWDQLIQYFGLDANPLAPEILPMVTCPSCERPGDGLTIHPPEKNPGQPWVAWDWQGREATPAERAYREAQLEEFRINAAHAEVARQVAKERFDQAQAEAKERKRIEAARERGIFLIGPPNPWAYRKKGRWL